MILFLLSFFALAECPKILGAQQDNGSWVFYHEAHAPSGLSLTEVPKGAIDKDCKVDSEILEMKKEKLAVSDTKKAAKETRITEEKAVQASRKTLKDKVKSGKLSETEKDEAIKMLLQELKE